MADKAKTEKFYQLWTLELDKLLEGYIYNEAGKPNPTRYIFSYYVKLLENFLNNRIDEIDKINLLSSLRGVGKTTLLGQIFYASKFIWLSQKENYLKVIEQDYQKLYLDVSRLSAEGISLNEFFNYYQEVNNISFVSLNKKLLILLDEVHYDEKWGLFLKVLFDSAKGHKNLLVIATGSSALKLKLNPDLSRRSLSQEIYPLKFNEFVILKGLGLPEKGLSDKLIGAVLLSKNVQELYNICENLSPQINRYFLKLPIKIEEEFFYYGGFPFVLRLKNKKSLVYELISGVIDKLIIKDILEMRKFSSETISKIKDLLYLIANSDKTDFDKLCATLKLDYRSVRGIVDALVQSGILIEVKSYGQKFTKVRKPIKFLFISPSLRAGILNGVIPSEVKGKILEDYFTLIFTKDFRKKISEYRGVELMYDSSSGGADFILRDGKKKIIIEVGYGDKTEGLKQIKTTGKTIGGFDYGIVISAQDNDLEILEENIVKMPLKIWLAI